jgi:multicomponent Na+:H+ antiporter subunit C
MQLITAIMISILFGCALYLILQKCFIKILFGFALLNHAGNILLLNIAGNPIGKTAPILLEGITSYVDPLPQALILTAIVIGFGVTAFLIVFLYRLFLRSHTSNAEEVLNDIK